MARIDLADDGLDVDTVELAGETIDPSRIHRDAHAARDQARHLRDQLRSDLARLDELDDELVAGA